MAEFQCTGCLQTKPTSDFDVKKTKRGHYTRCRKCVQEVARIRIAKGVSSPRSDFVPRACTACGVVKGSEDFIISEFSKDGYTLKCKKCTLLWIDHKLTWADYQALMERQSGLCAICKDPMKVVNVDHDHACCPGRRGCGRCIRGLLCGSCNRGLGLFKDNPKSLLSAVDYLEGGDSHQ